MDESVPEEARFLFGRVLSTKGALEVMEEHGISPESLLRRHVHGDWGDRDDEGKKENELALKHQSHILSVYQIADGVRVWLITHADRSGTVFLLPSEY